MKITIVTTREGESVIGILENLEFMLCIRDLIKSFIFGKTKNLKVTVEYFERNETIKKDLTRPIYDYLNILAQTINRSLIVVENNISVEKGYIKNLLKEKDSFLIIKLQLIVQTLLWHYIESRLPRLPKQYQNWHFSQIIDLADAFNEIPVQMLSYCSSLNELRNNIAHKPMAFKFTNIKNKYKTTLYKKGGILFNIQNEPKTDEEIFKDWTTSFLISALFLGYLVSEKATCNEKLKVH